MTDLVYIQGEPCSACPVEKPYCEENLCTATPPQTEQSNKLEHDEL